MAFFPDNYQRDAKPQPVAASWQRRPSLDDPDREVVLSAQVLGGYGYPVRPGEPIALLCGPEQIEIRTADGKTILDAIAYGEVCELQVTGPGTVTKGGGFIGGGFGVRGAAEGMLIGGVLNALTTKTDVLTFVHIETEAGELFMHYDRLDPLPLRIELSPVFVRVRLARRAVE